MKNIFSKSQSIDSSLKNDRKWFISFGKWWKKHSKEMDEEYQFCTDHLEEWKEMDI